MTYVLTVQLRNTLTLDLINTLINIIIIIIKQWFYLLLSRRVCECLIKVRWILDNLINCTIFLHNMQNISSTKNIISAQYAQYFFYKKTTLFLHCTPLRPSQCPACPPQKRKEKEKRKEIKQERKKKIKSIMILNQKV